MWFKDSNFNSIKVTDVSLGASFICCFYLERNGSG